MRVVLDSNIFVSAFLRGALAEEIISLSIKRIIDTFISTEITEEIERVLIKKLKVREADAKDFINYVESVSALVHPKVKVASPLKDVEDNKILECALEAKADIIVTLDHHLLKLKNYRGIVIIHPKTLTWMIPDY